IALLTPLMTRHLVPRAAIMALLIGVGGIAYLFQIELRATPETFLGGTMIMISVFFSSISSVLAKRELARVSPVVSSTLQLAIGSVLLLVMSQAMERNQPSNWTGITIPALIFLGIFGSAAAFAIYYWLLKQIPAYKAASVNLVVPFVAILEGSLLL